eukprot:gene14913-biopygen7485
MWSTRGRMVIHCVRPSSCTHSITWVAQVNPGEATTAKQQVGNNFRDIFPRRRPPHTPCDKGGRRCEEGGVDDIKAWGHFGRRVALATFQHDAISQSEPTRHPPPRVVERRAPASKEERKRGGGAGGELTRKEAAEKPRRREGRAGWRGEGLRA